MSSMEKRIAGSWVNSGGRAACGWEVQRERGVQQAESGFN